MTCYQSFYWRTNNHLISASTKKRFWHILYYQSYFKMLSLTSCTELQHAFIHCMLYTKDIEQSFSECRPIINALIYKHTRIQIKTYTHKRAYTQNTYKKQKLHKIFFLRSNTYFPSKEQRTETFGFCLRKPWLLYVTTNLI